MAKRKHSTALFEVITKSRRYTKPQPASAAPPSTWWFKRRAKPDATSREPAAAEPIAQAAAPAPVRMDPPPAPEPRWSPQPEPARYDEHEGYDEHAEFAPSDLGGEDVLSTPRAQSVAVTVDPDRRQIALRMSYTAAIIGGFAVLVLVGLAIIVGQHMTRSGAPLLAQTTSKALQESPPHREVMEVNRQSLATPNIGSPDGGRSQAQPPSTNPQPAPGNAVETKRYVGLNYVIVQGYASKEQDMAEKAVAFLNKHGIPCTVEKGVSGYSPVTVVGLQGFDRQTSPAIKAYIQKIEDLSAEYTTNSRGYKAFTPLVKKWDKTN